MTPSLAQDVRIIENFGGVEWSNHTQLHPLGLALTLICGAAVLAVPRRFAIWPFVLLACVVAPAQRLVVGGLDFNLVRIMVLFGFARVLMRSEFRDVRWFSVDYIIIAFAVVRTFTYTALHGTSAAFIFQAGQTFDAVGLYFLFRALIRRWDDVARTAAGFVVLSVPIAFAFLIENRTGRNAFAFFGGVPEITVIREDRMRCQGAFAHPIIAGCFWASVLPMIVALFWWGPVNRLLALVGTFCALAIVFLSASSTPVMGVIFAVVGGLLFFTRFWMKQILIGVVILLFALHLSMKAPVWHLVSRITVAKGNTGYHRFLLIDNAIRHFSEWAALGTKSTAHWFWGGQDVTNQYVLEAVRGGFLALALFVATIWLCFAANGRTWRVWSKDAPRLYMSWALGVCLFVHCTNFIGVSYFGQGVFLWYLALAMTVSMWEHSGQVQQAAAFRAARRQQAGGSSLLGPAAGAGPFGMPPPRMEPGGPGAAR